MEIKEEQIRKRLQEMRQQHEAATASFPFQWLGLGPMPEPLNIPPLLGVDPPDEDDEIVLNAAAPHWSKR